MKSENEKCDLERFDMKNFEFEFKNDEDIEKFAAVMKTRKYRQLLQEIVELLSFNMENMELWYRYNDYNRAESLRRAFDALETDAKIVKMYKYNSDFRNKFNRAISVMT